MLKPAAAKSLFVSLIAAFTLACTPNAVFGEHGRRGSHGGGASHRGGFHVGGHFDGGGGRSFRGGRGSRGSTGGRYRGGNSRPTRSARSQMGGSSLLRSGRFDPRAYGNSAHVGGRGMRSSDPWHSFRNTPRTAPNAFAPRANFDPSRRPLARTPYASWSDQSRSNTPRSGLSFDSNRPPSASSPSRNWPRQDRRSFWATNPRPVSSFDSNRPPSATPFRRSGFRQSRPSSASAPLSTVSRSSNRAPSARLASSGWSGPNRSSGNASSPASRFNFDRGLSNFRNTRFGDSRLGRSSFAGSRFGSHGSSLGHSRFTGDEPFNRGGAAFGREASFGGGDSSFVPDLFGWALGLGTLAISGLDLLGPGLTAFGLRGVGFLGWGLLNSVSGESSSDANLQSPYFAPCPTLYPTGNWVCQQ
jgi:hypothetical protein